MGDRVTIPRTLAGLIGVADVHDSLKRKYVVIPIEATTARFMGNGTTGGLKFLRNVILDRAHVSFVADRTTSHVHKYRLVVNKNNSTVMQTNAAAAPYGSTGSLLGATTGWKANELTPITSALASITSSDRITVSITHHTDAILRPALTLEFREALDS